MRNQDFIITSLQSWDITIGSNAKDIALEISKSNRVLYINTPLDIKTFFSHKNSPETQQRRNVIRHKKSNLRQVNPNLWVLDLPFTILPINFLPDGFLFDFVNKINNHKIYTSVKKALKHLNFENYILFIDNDIYRSFYSKDFLKPAFSIYYRRDNLLTYSYWMRHAKRLEPKLCSKCDLVVTNSIKLADDVSIYNSQAYDIGQGVDLSNYDINKEYIEPLDIKSIPHPIIGYAGCIIFQRLDANLLYQIAQQRKQYSFVMVGKEDDYFKNHQLHTLPNVYFTGEKKPNEIPNYINAFDVCINPQKINEITIGNYPRKIDEYLALGKPIVATDTDTMRDLFQEHVFLASNLEEYSTGIDKALSEVNNSQKQEERIAFAHTHSWFNSVNKMYRILETFIKRNNDYKSK